MNLFCLVKQVRVVFFVCGGILLLGPPFSYASREVSKSERLVDRDCSEDWTEVNGLRIAGTPASQEWFKNHVKEESMWMNLLVEDMAKIGISQTRLECPVCLDKFHESKDLIVSQCKHLFCERCYDSLNSNYDVVTTCPCCRAEDWRGDTIKVTYASSTEEYDLNAKVISVDGLSNFAFVELDRLLGPGLKDLSDFTWYVAKKKPKSYSCFPFVPKSNARLLSMNQSSAELYCSKRKARLPSRNDFDRLQRQMAYPLTPDLFESIPVLSDIEKNWFWTSESTSGLYDRGFVFDGKTGTIDLKLSQQLGSVLCIKP